VLVVTRGAAGVVVLLLPGALFVAVHAVLHLPADGSADDEEARLCSKPEPPPAKLAPAVPRRPYWLSVS
jgi:hypothetical protein